MASDMPRIVSPGCSTAVYAVWFACAPECGCTFAQGAPNSFFARSMAMLSAMST